MIYAMHAVVDREYLDHLSDTKLLEKYNKLLSELPDPKSNLIRQHLEDSLFHFYCRCGCHSFYVQPRNHALLPKLRDYGGVYREIAYNTNYSDELNVMLIIDDSGVLCQVTVLFGRDNLKAIPDDLIIKGIEGIW
jgi:hypothetical protein